LCFEESVFNACMDSGIPGTAIFWASFVRFDIV
jgi:hypothetical protein